MAVECGCLGRVLSECGLFGKGVVCGLFGKDVECGLFGKGVERVLEWVVLEGC